ncbi:MAG TPA: hypothetical protein VHW64_14580 [Nocardioides sp.]|jgi:hypothetical protein|uniref:hypothetical protein n=1 Tax=Nocardioides sp. TaxID=35761 RepID=UPI002E349FDC|nr:hypothetical protein [Nocardioides sp.]HEX3931927.1 hypothetical protein [Nocardioides sp.]
MLTLSSVRRTGAVLAASALTLSLVAAGGAAQASPANRSADWMSGQLTNGLLVGSYLGTPYDDYGPTIDTAFALKALGNHSGKVAEIRNALEKHPRKYISYKKARYSGPTAKLLVFAERTKGATTSFGGVNLVGWLNGMVTKKGHAKGRIADRGSADYANVTGQILAVRGLTWIHSRQAAPTLKFLLEQQCSKGYFRLSFSPMGTKHQGCRASDPADPDTTSYAVVELWKQSRHEPQLRAALKRAVTWLAKRQHANGAFVGGATTAFPNSNSTGLAGWALGLTGHCSAARAAARWVGGLQVGAQKSGSPLAGDRGAIAYRASSLRTAEKDGITADAQDEWWRATSQGAPVLTYRHGC